MNWYLDNKYSKWYFSLIEQSRYRTIIEPLEKHHVWPKSLGGSNDTVRLTLKEHFIAHRLLVKMTDGPARRKMSYALHMMSKFERYTNVIRLTPEEKHRITTKYRQILVEDHTGKKLSLKTRQKMSLAAKGKPKSPEHRAKISAAHKGQKHKWQNTINHNPEKIRKTAEKHRGMKRSLETCQRISTAKMGHVPWNKGIVNVQR